MQKQIGPTHFREQHKGFTLIELLITVAVGAVLVGLAIPSLEEFIRNARVKAQEGEFITGLNTARTESIKRGLNIVMCAGTPTAGCVGTWKDDGWIIFEDRNYDQTLGYLLTDLTDTCPDPEVDECILSSNSDGVNFMNIAPAGTDLLSFTPSGSVEIDDGGTMSANTQIVFTVEKTSGEGSDREICISPMGRFSVTDDEESCMDWDDISDN